MSRERDLLGMFRDDLLRKKARWDQMSKEPAFDLIKLINELNSILAQPEADRWPDACPQCGKNWKIDERVKVTKHGNDSIFCGHPWHDSAPPAQSATPETDVWNAIYNNPSAAKKLHEQRDALRAENERLRELIKSYQLGALPSGGEK